ncbi:MAG: DNA-binding NtrC family response regulator [Halioglobus sp.]|jgi:DNA-binding NtrC family response regulator
MSQFKIFIVEDDPWYGELLKYHLSLNPEYDVTVFELGKDCLANLHLNPDVVCIDFGLPDMEGDKLFEKICAVNSSIPVIVISGQEEVSVAVDLLKSGVSDYIIKDDNSKKILWNSILKLRETAGLRKEVEVLKEQLGQKFDFEKSIIGQSSAMKKTFSLIEKATKTNINVSITGETGTGKELVAKAIHYNSNRKKKPFVAVNMAAIPKELVESELFGHEKGAFTGAVTRKIGKFEEAQGGTIFLDEVSELDFSVQSKILRVLQEREVVRVGGNEKIKLDVRLLTATHKNLIDGVKEGTFREDLYYRVIGLPIELPPLRDRGSDILILAKHFFEAFTKDNNINEVRFSDGAKEKLLSYSFPGNVRELKAIVDLSCVMCDGNEVVAKDITYAAIKSDEHFVTKEKTLREYDCDIIEYFLNKYSNNVKLVAKKLDIGKSTIYKMIKENGLTK